MENYQNISNQTESHNYCDCVGVKRQSLYKKIIFFILAILINSVLTCLLILSIFSWFFNDTTQESNVVVDNRVVQPVKIVEEQSQVIEVAKNASPAVVSIVATTEVPTYENLYQDFFDFRIPSKVQNGTERVQVSAGTGFLVSSDGYIITNKHVVNNQKAEYTVILNNKENFDQKVVAKVLAIDPDNDVAVLKIDLDQPLPFLTFGDSDYLQVGQTTIAIGYALGKFDNTLSKGVVSGLSRSITASGNKQLEYLQDLIQTTAAVNPGNSGGPLLDIDGKVIGVNVAMADAQNISFAIPINYIKTVFEEAKSTGVITKSTKVFLGVRYLEIDDNVQSKNKLPYSYGVVITRGNSREELAVIPGSPAAKAGLAEGDIILAVNKEKITARNSLQKLLFKYSAGDKVSLRVYKDGLEKDIQVVLGDNR